MPAENDTGSDRVAVALPSRQAARSRRTASMGALGVGAGHDDRELVATDPEGPVASGAGRSPSSSPACAEELVADRVAARVVDLLEVVEVEDRERQRLVVPGRDRPLALHLLLERPVVAEPRQRVAQGLGARPVVGVLEDPPRLLEPLGRLQHAARQPDGEQAEEDGQRPSTPSVGTSSEVPNPQASP